MKLEKLTFVPCWFFEFFEKWYFSRVKVAAVFVGYMVLEFRKRKSNSLQTTSLITFQPLMRYYIKRAYYIRL
jgi:hypothetical protein